MITTADPAHPIRFIFMDSEIPGRYALAPSAASPFKQLVAEADADQ
jgi:hypothetical protein